MRIDRRYSLLEVLLYICFYAGKVFTIVLEIMTYACGGTYGHGSHMGNTAHMSR